MSKPYDVEVTLTLNAVVRGAANEEEAKRIARDLATAVVNVNECLNGSDYGVPGVTEFSINDPDESIDVEEFDDGEPA